MPRKKKGVLVNTSPAETVRKHVGAIHTSGDLSLLERKTANVLLLNAYQHLLTRRTHKIPVPLLCAMLGYDSNDVDKLKEVLRKLASTMIEFNVMEDGKEAWQVMSMISFGEIKGGVCTYRYDEYLAERFYDPEIYAIINLAVQRKFESGYALTLYENCLRYKAVGSTGWWDIERFRHIMGATASMYDEFKNLSRVVIAKPVEHINRVSDIRIEQEYQKNGRKVTGVRFVISESPQKFLLTNQATDQYAGVREHPTYKRLVEHGIGDRLAIYWVTQDEQRIAAVVEYVETKDKKNQVKGTTAGYIRRLIEEKADVGPTAYQRKKQEAERLQVAKEEGKKRERLLAELEDEYLKYFKTAVIKAMTITERHEHAMLWLKTEKGRGQDADYDPAKADFKTSTNKINFNQVYLRQKIQLTIDDGAFFDWVKQTKGIDLHGLTKCAASLAVQDGEGS